MQVKNDGILPTPDIPTYYIFLVHSGVLISRPSGSLSLCNDPVSLSAEMTRGGAKRMLVFGVVGVANAPNRAASFLVVVRRKVRVGVVRGSPVWRHDGVEVIGIRRKSGAKGGSREDEDEAQVRSFLVQVLATPYFYFTYDSDLTQTQQRLFTMGDQEKDTVMLMN